MFAEVNRQFNKIKWIKIVAKTTVKDWYLLQILARIKLYFRLHKAKNKALSEFF
jgi:hypothetical protein